MVGINLTGALASFPLAGEGVGGEELYADGGQLSGGAGGWTLTLAPYGSSVVRFPLP